MIIRDGSSALPVAFALLAGMAVKHYAADFLLQTNWMARGKEMAHGWARPLLAHAGLHGLMTAAIAAAVLPRLWWLGAVDFAVHAAIDRGKSAVSLRRPLPVSDARFWWLLGFDQLLHQITNIGLVGAMVALA